MPAVALRQDRSPLLELVSPPSNPPLVPPMKSVSPVLRLLLLPALLCGLLASAHAAVETYAIDPVHSSVGFSIRHFISKVPGSFTQFSGTITVDRDNLEHSSVDATIDVGSINTRNEKRDSDLRSPHFFDAAKFSTITFKSSSWKKTGEDTYDVTGDLKLTGGARFTVDKKHFPLIPSWFTAAGYGYPVAGVVDQAGANGPAGSPPIGRPNSTSPIRRWSTDRMRMATKPAVPTRRRRSSPMRWHPTRSRSPTSPIR